ncbi:MAG TPA: aspartyl/asparaginyl beta-hydroxylase domain-containing protein [Bacteroidia bacterium]|jgi:aspartyl/asparaginyl beta-hydroxylase (cupin superfamily)|nr:aspartyl/asparaginyl beta-hydroxylase domain-containing protein [Bacteroidia bacterium]
MEKIKKWYSFAESEVFTGSEPPFFDISQKPWKKLLEENYAVISTELMRLINKKEPNIIPYLNQTLASTPTSWTIFPLRMWNRPYEENCNKVPFTMQMLSKINGVTSCSFSILKPQTKIKPHFGDSNVMYRCHLTLKSPGMLPEIGLRVNGKEISWENGKLFAFCDAHKHEVWNNTKEERWVLIIDILREEFLSEEKQICKEVNATLWWQLKFQRFYFIKHLPKFSRRWLMKATAVFMK